MANIEDLEKEMIKRRASMVFHGQKNGMSREEVMEYAEERYRNRYSTFPTFDSTVDRFLDSREAFRSYVREVDK